MVCVPFSNDYDNLGVIQFVKGRDSEPFDGEAADVMEIMAMTAAMALEENEELAEPWEPGEVIMSLRDVTREFVNGDVVTKVLRGVNLDVYEGEFLVLLGESGCGKSTLLNIIGGMDSATSGTIECLGQDLTSATQKELTEFRRQNLGFIFQSYNLISRLTSFRNLTLISELVDEPMDVDDRTPTDDKRPPRRQDPPSVASYFLTLPKSSQAKDGPRGARNTWKGAHRRLTGPTHDGRDVGLSGSLDRPAPFSNARRPFCVRQPRGTV